MVDFSVRWLFGLVLVDERHGAAFWVVVSVEDEVLDHEDAVEEDREDS